MKKFFYIIFFLLFVLLLFVFLLKHPGRDEGITEMMPAIVDTGSLSSYKVEAFSGIIYKYVDFSNSKIIGQNKEANMQRIWGNKKLGSTYSPNPYDKIIIVDNDTIWSCMLPGTPTGNQGVQYKGDMQLNGKDSSDDTLTYACFTYFIRLDENFDWSKGGKQPGLAGSNRPGCLTQNPPSGGLYAPSCGRECNEAYCACAGFSARFARQSLTAGGENTCITIIWIGKTVTKKHMAII